jgi:hypothetical protein
VRDGVAQRFVDRFRQPRLLHLIVEDERAEDVADACDRAGLAALCHGPVMNTAYGIAERCGTHSVLSPSLLVGLGPRSGMNYRDCRSMPEIMLNQQDLDAFE